MKAIILDGIAFRYDRVMNEFTCQSKINNIYRIYYDGPDSDDPKFLTLFKCTCMAAQHEKECKHIKTFRKYYNEIQNEFLNRR